MRMRFLVHRSGLELLEGDIVAQDVDALVNAANSSLLGWGWADPATGLRCASAKECLPHRPGSRPADVCVAGTAVVAGKNARSVSIGCRSSIMLTLNNHAPSQRKYPLIGLAYF